MEGIPSKVLFSISNFMLKRNDINECFIMNKSYSEKRVAILEALKAFHLLINNFPDDKLVSQEDYDENFQFASESLSDVCFTDLTPDKINKTMEIILDRTQKLSKFLSTKFPKKIEEQGEELKLVMSGAGNNLENITSIKERLSKDSSYLIHFSKGLTMDNQNLFFNSSAKEYLTTFSAKSRRIKKFLKKTGKIAGGTALTLGAGAGYIALDRQKQLKGVEDSDAYKEALKKTGANPDELSDSAKINLTNTANKYNKIKDSLDVSHKSDLESLPSNLHDDATRIYQYRKGLVDSAMDKALSPDSLNSKAINNPITLWDKLKDLAGKYGENDKIGLGNYMDAIAFSNKDYNKNEVFKNNLFFGLDSKDYLNSVKMFHDADASLVDKLKFDIKDENEAIEEYTEHINTIQNPKAKAVLSHIRDEEVEHLEELTDLLGDISNQNEQNFFSMDGKTYLKNFNKFNVIKKVSDISRKVKRAVEPKVTKFFIKKKTGDDNLAKKGEELSNIKNNIEDKVYNGLGL